MQLTTTRKVMVGFAASLGVMGAIAAVSYMSTQRLIDDIEDVAHTYQVMGEVRDVGIVTSRMFSSVGGYVITGKDDRLETFLACQREMPQQIKDVRDLILEKPEQMQRLDTIEKLLAQQMDYARNLVAVRKAGGFAAAEAVVNTGEGRKRVNLIMEMIEQMLKFEDRLLKERKEIAHNSVWMANILIVIGGVLTAIIMVAASMVLRQDIRERERLERAILEVGDRKQQQIGHDLHDGVCQELAGIAFMGQVVERKLAANSPTEAAEVAKMTALVGRAVTHARSLARGLQPVEVESNGLMVALEEMARNISGMFHVECLFVCEGEILIADNTVAVHLYRIAQEAVHNSIRHGGAKNVRIRLQASKGRVTLEIRDDGKGMPDVLPERRGMGIETMRYRAEALGATLEFRRAPSRGTLVICSFKPAPTQMKKTKVMQTV